jgi:hypothetical protein
MAGGDDRKQASAISGLTDDVMHRLFVYASAGSQGVRSTNRFTTDRVPR